jgi:hypothetical protein
MADIVRTARPSDDDDRWTVRGVTKAVRDEAAD